MNAFDGCFIQQHIPRIISWVVTDNLMRKWWLKKLLLYVGFIPKSKFVSDRSTVKEILRAKKEGGIIGIFPEGRRNWDGKTLPLLPSTAKLAKMLNIPVVCCLTEGGYLDQPRWAKHQRQGEVHLTITKVLTTANIKAMTVEEIHDFLTEKLSHDEMDFQDNVEIRFKGRRLAENVERYIFTCPHCRSIGTMRSRKDDVYCTNCVYKVKFDYYGNFEQVNHPIRFSTVSRWARWENEHLKYIIDKSSDQEMIFEDKDVSLFITREGYGFKRLASGYVQLGIKYLTFYSKNRTRHRFMVNEIMGANIHGKNQVEMTYRGKCYRIRFNNSWVSAFKWTSAIGLISGNPCEGITPSGMMVMTRDDSPAKLTEGKSKDIPETITSEETNDNTFFDNEIVEPTDEKVESEEAITTDAEKE